jgi:hypothetical protein
MPGPLDGDEWHPLSFAFVSILEIGVSFCLLNIMYSSFLSLKIRVKASYGLKKTVQ